MEVRARDDALQLEHLAAPPGC